MSTPALNEQGRHHSRTGVDEISNGGKPTYRGVGGFRKCQRSKHSYFRFALQRHLVGFLHGIDGLTHLLVSNPRIKIQRGLQIKPKIFVMVGDLIVCVFDQRFFLQAVPLPAAG